MEQLREENNQSSTVGHKSNTYLRIHLRCNTYSRQRVQE